VFHTNYAALKLGVALQAAVVATVRDDAMALIIVFHKMLTR
jgi:hypothetical protein